MPQLTRSLLDLTDRALSEDICSADAIVADVRKLPPLTPDTQAIVRLPDDDEPTLRALVALRPHAALLAGCRSGAEVQRLDVLLSVAEAEEGLEVGATRIFALTDGLLPPPLDPAGFHRKSARLAGLVWDWRMLVDTLGTSRWRDLSGRWTDAFAGGRTAVLLAARAAGVSAYEVAAPGAACAFADDCIHARDDGFAGRVATDASQLPAINAAFAKTA